MGWLGFLVPAWLRVAAAAILNYYRPAKYSQALKDYGRRQHLAIEMDEPFRAALPGGRWMFVCRPLSVADCEHLARVQYLTRAALVPLEAIDRGAQPAVILKAARLKVEFYRLAIGMLTRLSEEHYRGMERLRYRRALGKALEKNVALGLQLLNSLLEYNSRLDSFFFASPRIRGSTISERPRDAARAVRYGLRKGGEWPEYTSTPILKIYSEIVYNLEEGELAAIHAAREKAESNGV